MCAFEGRGPGGMRMLSHPRVREVYALEKTRKFQILNFPSPFYTGTAGMKVGSFMPKNIFFYADANFPNIRPHFFSLAIFFTNLTRPISPVNNS